MRDAGVWKAAFDTNKKILISCLHVGSSIAYCDHHCVVRVVESRAAPPCALMRVAIKFNVEQFYVLRMRIKRAVVFKLGRA